MTRSARILFDFDNTVILLENPTGHALVGRAGAGRAAAHRRILGAAGQGRRRGRSRAGAPPGLHRARERQQLGLAEEQLLRILGTDSLVCVPLVAGARCLGVLVGGVPAWQLPACQQRERFMQAFGAQAASALENGAARTRPRAPPARQRGRGIPRSLAPRGARGEQPAVDHQELPERPRQQAGAPRTGGRRDVDPERGDRPRRPADQRPGRTACAGDRSAAGRRCPRRRRRAAPVPRHRLRAGRRADRGAAWTATAPIEGDADLLKQILVNLVKNAVEAFGPRTAAGSRSPTAATSTASAICTSSWS